MRTSRNFAIPEHAQVEIKEIAQQMWDLVTAIDGGPFKHNIRYHFEKDKWCIINSISTTLIRSRTNETRRFI